MVITTAQELIHFPCDVIPIIGIYADSYGHSCIEHTYCGQQVQLNSVHCVWRERICTLWGEETARCCYIEKDGIDECHIGFLRCNCIKFDKYNSALFQVVDVTSHDDADTTRRTKFHCFCLWADAAIIGVTEHCCSSGDEQPSRKNKKLSIIMKKKIILII